jgi:CubicO group peptidase (beta-lactamase class C family)
MRKFILTLIFISVSGAGIAQNLAADVDALLSTQYKAGEPGAVVLISKSGKPVYKKAFGMADLENNVPMRTENVFEIGSITKQFTAVAILMLMEQGKLSLEDPVTKFIESYPMNDHMITIHHLLTHTSGIKSYTGMERWTKLWRNDMTPSDMIDLFKNEPMEFAPGEKWNYNNSGYFLLGYIIEKASGMSYPEYLQKNIFTPLDLKNTYYGSKSRVIANRAQGYQREGTAFVNAEYLSLTQPYAAGSIMSTVEDLLIWNNAVQSNKIVKKETIQKAFTNYKLKNGKPLNYGYGWGLNEINGSPTIEHSGGIFGYSTNAIYLPKEDVFVVAYSNCDCNPPGDVSTRIAALAVGKPFADPSAKIKLDEAYAKSLTGVYEFEDGAIRIITYENGQLYSQRPGSTKYKIFPQDKVTFTFEAGISMLQFVFDKNVMKEVLFKNRIDVEKGVKTNKPIPVREEASVGAEALKKYVGVYELAPSFSITITLEEGHLMAQATGQNKFEIFAESETKFFYKVVDAQIEFVSANGAVDSMILYQGGQKIPGKKKN